MNEYSSIMRAFSLQMLNEVNIGILFLAHLHELTQYHLPESFRFLSPNEMEKRTSASVLF